MEIITRKTTKQERMVCEYLNELRSSGVINMFGASPYIIEEFGVTQSESRQLLSLWMANFNEECDYKDIAINL